MKKQLLKHLLISAVVIFGFTNANAQLFDFTASTDNFIVTGAASVDVSSGTTMLITALDNRGNVYIEQETAANSGYVVDASTYIALRVVVKNNTSLNRLSLRLLAGNTTVGSFQTISTGDTAFQTYIFDMSGAGNWTGMIESWRIFLGFNNTGVGNAETLEFDSIEFLTSLPDPNSYSEFIQDPSFEVAGLSNYGGGGGGVVDRAIESTVVIEGAQSLKNTFTGDAESGTGTMGGPGPYWNFGQYVHEYAAGVITDQSVATVTIQVRSTRSAPARIISRIRTRNSTDMNINTGGFPTDTQLTSGVPGQWDLLTFTMPIPYDHTVTATEVRDMTFWFGVDYDPLDTDGVNANNGDIFYFDNMNAALGTLSVKGNTLEGVSVYPNPARDVLTLNTPRGGDITVYNILGAQVKTDKTLLKEYRMNVSDLKSGIYLLRVNSDGKQFTQKLVIQ